MTVFRIFIDGQAGTTGLQIRQRLAAHPHIKVLTIEYDLRRDASARRALMASVDVTVLCLPDDAAREAAQLAQSVGCRVLDASSAHRTVPSWVFGLPELVPTQRAAIASARQVANPGCYATGAILLLRPLIEQKLLRRDTVFCINAISGYTGGGTKMVEQYKNGGPAYVAYTLDFDHKHIPEIQTWGDLSTRPIFHPAVGNFDQGMLVFIPVVHEPGRSQALHSTLQQRYEGEKFVKVQGFNVIDPAGVPMLTPHGTNGSNNIELFVLANSTYPDRTLLVARLDNLGKGASGAAVQNLNLMLGLQEDLCTHLAA
ncbi:N-acetyl-gamma-glutamyl-phosphate reductase [Glaciimonas immobilis]|uniref:N-acetyl-gamma-glutamyl-phosphate reductase n=1 Tax=Glaciimonas immobilis TaxID=728004 RepID=A0A840RZZ5_9BURK|nr:N-acetyl-gamma-glutamyl-phosphate reductase [Glaciimonas immobilis]KAF3995937.1 N-acetyl-gamma-glutamyl-phosphate reductase [Glaciimonas immobilis]MBB5202678.1 N-acetyl-gamma-glutamyl-phosphate reductase [Glaciimonas immobilis]